MSPNLIVPIVVAPLVVWRVYSRMRRTFGRQPIQPRRMWARVALLLCVLALLVAVGGFHDARLGEGLATGLLGGAVLGLVALKLTRFEIDGSNDCYFPNPWIGLALATLILGRLLHRLMVIGPEMSQAAGGGYAGLHRNPLTMALLGLLLSYYIAYYAGLLVHHRRVLAARAGTTDAASKPRS